MSLRPKPARWFEILLSRNEISSAAEALAHTGMAEIAEKHEGREHASTPALEEKLQEFTHLSQKYRHYWPQHDLYVSHDAGSTDERLEQAITKLNKWRLDADPVITASEQLRGERNALLSVAEWLGALQASNLNFSLVGQNFGILEERLFKLGERVELTDYPHSVLVSEVMTDETSYLYTVGPVTQLDQLQEQLQAYKCQLVELPQWMQGDTDEVLAELKLRRDSLNQKIEQHQQTLNKLNQRWALSEALADLMQLEWFFDNVRDQNVTENFAWITGWTSDISGHHLSQALQDADIKALVNYPLPPMERDRPLVMDNPTWAKPFELFASLLGTPGSNEADPAQLLALVVPLVFGYMFGDVGHGLVLAAAGWYFHKRWPALGILFACGISSILFGFVFGSVFGNEHLIEPLWVSPVKEPLPVLMVPLAGGVVLLLIGMLMNCVEAFWSGQIRLWLMREAPVVLMYLSIVTLLFFPSALIIFWVALCWYLLGNFLSVSHKRLNRLLTSLGELVESLFQLAVNTVSFIRVGAFALAHAGLSLAFTIMASSIDNLFISISILVLGNVVVLLLEGLVVSIQTTRLVLFEFFIRFLHAEGRTLRPLKAPEHAFLRRSKE